MDDARFLDELRRYWDEIARGGPATPGDLDPDLAATIRRLHAMPDVPPPNPTYAKNLRESIMHASTAPIPLTIGPPLDGHAAPSIPRPWPAPIRLPQGRRAWPLAQAAVVLLLVASVVIAYFTVFRQGDEPSRLVPGVATPTSEATPANDWPMYRGNPARTGEMAGPGPQGQPVELWRFQTQGPALRSPAIVNDVVYAGSGDGFLYALDRASGDEIWRYQADGPVEITPTVIGDTVYIASLTGTLAVIDAASGEERWRFAEAVAPDSTPVIVDGALFVGSENGNLYALDPASGEELWRNAASGGLTRSIAVAGGLAYVGSEAGQLHAVDTASGEERWVFVPENAAESSIGTPTVFNGMVIANHAGTMYALDAASGAEQWRSALGDGARPATAGGDALYTGGPDGLVRAIDAATGEVRWTFATNDQILAAPALVDDTLYVASFDRTIYALDAATGEERWGFAVDHDVDYGPSVADGVIYVSTRLGTVYAIGGSGTGQLTAPAVDEATPVPAMESDASEFAGEITGGDDPLNGPAGMAVGTDGTLYVAEGSSDRIRVFDREGAPIAAWGETGTEPGQFQFERGDEGGFGDVKIGPDGSLYVLENIGRRVQQFSPDGEFVAAWGGFGAGDGEFIGPNTLTIDADGRVHVVDQDAARIQVFAADGAFLKAWGAAGEEPGQLDKPWELVVRPDGTYLVSDTGGRILAFDAEGSFTGVFVEGGENFHPDSAFGLDIDAAGNVYAYDYLANTIFVFDPDGALLASWGEAGSGPGQFLGPNDIALGPDGLLYVADYENNRVQVFQLPNLAAQTSPVELLWQSKGGPDAPLTNPATPRVAPDGSIWVIELGNARFQVYEPDGAFRETWGERGSGSGQFAFTSGENLDGWFSFAADGTLYVSDTFNNRVQKFDPERRFVTEWGGFGDGDGQFLRIAGVVIDGDGNVVVCDRDRADCQIFTPDGQFLSSFNDAGGDGQLREPGGMTSDGDGNVYLADYGHNRVFQFAPGGELLASWGEPGSGPGQLDEANDVAVDAAGNVYVADAYNGRIQVFDASGEFLAEWDGSETEAGQFSVPSGVALDADGNAYVVDIDRGLVTKFRLLPPLT